MLAKESVRTRVASEHGISFTEFSYMLLQANDYAWLHEHMDCELQAGGSDQWGNITAGIELVRTARGASVLRAHGAPRHALGRREVRQERRGRALARSRAHVALRALSVLRQPARRRCRALPAAAHARARRGGAARGGRARAGARAPRRPAAAGLGDVRADPRSGGGGRGCGGVDRVHERGRLALGRATRGAHRRDPDDARRRRRPRRRRPAGREQARGQQGRGAPADRRRRHLRQRRCARRGPRARPRTISCTAAT